MRGIVVDLQTDPNGVEPGEASRWPGLGCGRDIVRRRESRE